MNAGEIETRVKTRESQLEPLHTRMDKDFKRWNLEKTTYDKHKTAINITLNDPRTFADDVQSTLSRAEMQIIIRLAEKGVDRRDDIAKRERLFHFAFDKADERLRRLLLPPLRGDLIWQGNIRGWRASRVLIEKYKDKLIFNFIALDPRWLTWEVGADGLLWVAYKTFKSKASLKDEWKYEPKGVFLSSMFGTRRSSTPVIDYWEMGDKVTNAVACQGEFLKEPEAYDLTSIPILISPVAIRPPIATETSPLMEGYGESIYAPNRDTYDILNELVSLEATRAKLLSKQPMVNYFRTGGITEITDTLMQPELVLNLPADLNKLESVPMKEVPATLLQMVNELNIRRARAEVPHLELGKPPPSGTALDIVREAGDKVFVPQLISLSSFYEDMCRLIEEQLISKKIKVKVQSDYKRNYFEADVTPTELKEAHTIKVEFTSRTPWSQMDSYMVADMAKRIGLPDEFIWEHILKLPDPRGLKGQAAIEVAEHSPNLARARAILALMEEGREDEAEQLMRELYQEEVQQQVAPEERVI